MTIKFNKIAEEAVIPYRTENSGAGYNLTVAGVTTEINQRGQVVVVYHSGIAIEVPEGFEATVRPDGSISNKTIRMCGAPSVVNSSEEIVGKFIVTTDVIPSVYEKGDVFAHLVISEKEDIEFDEISAATGSQSLPENEGTPTNSGTAKRSKRRGVKQP